MLKDAMPDDRRDHGIEDWRPLKSLPEIGVSMLIVSHIINEYVINEKVLSVEI